MNAFRLTTRVRPAPRRAYPAAVRAPGATVSVAGPSRSAEPVHQAGAHPTQSPQQVEPTQAAQPTQPTQPTQATQPTPVPWRIVARSESGTIEIENQTASPLRAVRFALAGGGMLGVSLPRTVHPGERLRVVLRGVHADGATAAADAMLVLRWVQPNGTELLWPIAL